MFDRRGQFTVSFIQDLPEMKSVFSFVWFVVSAFNPLAQGRGRTKEIRNEMIKIQLSICLFAVIDKEILELVPTWKEMRSSRFCWSKSPRRQQAACCIFLEKNNFSVPNLISKTRVVLFPPQARCDRWAILISCITLENGNGTKYCEAISSQRNFSGENNKISLWGLEVS